MTGRPLPDVDDPEFAPFWTGTARAELRIPRCTGCGRFGWPPRPVCPGCHGFGFAWETVPPRGLLYSWTVVGHQTMKGLPPPYVVGLVELADGVRLLGNVVGTEPAALRVGLPLAARFDGIADGVTLVNWRMVGEHD
jgi:uncharacterized OB-fold protein